MPSISGTGGRWPTLSHALLALACVAAALTIACWYVSTERTFHYWDGAYYHDAVLLKTIRIMENADIVQIARDTWTSTANDYSDYFTLPLVPFALAFGESRLTFILALTLCYLLPFAAAVGALAARLLPERPAAAFWSTALLALAMPAVWVPTLFGYPDVGAAALLAVGLFAHCRPGGARLHSAALAGVAIAFSVLLRRHFLYGALALFAALVIQVLLDWLRDRSRGQRWHRLVRTALPVAASGVACLAVLLVFGWPFVKRLLTTDFNALYASYAVPVADGAGYYLTYFGWLPTGLALAGLSSALLHGVVERRAATLVILFSILSAAHWLIGARQLGLHYTLHFAPGVILGTAVLAWTIHLRGAARTGRALAAALFAALAVNGWAVFGPATAERTALWSRSHPPNARTDYDDLVRLVGSLDAATTPDDVVFVAASSGILSDDLLWHVDRTLRGDVMRRRPENFWDDSDLGILHWVPFADSRDPYPLGRLMRTTMVVVARPFQAHLRLEEHDVLKVVHDLFTEDGEFAKDFVALDDRFTLDGRVDVTLYRRVRPTSLEVALRTLDAMRTRIGERPGGQGDWIDLGTTGQTWVSGQPGQPHRIAVKWTGGTIPFAHAVAVDQPLTVSGRLRAIGPTCPPDTTLQATAYDAAGRPGEAASVAQEGGAFSTPLPVATPGHLVLTVAASPEPLTQPCWLTLQDLTVTPRQMVRAAQ